MHVRSGTPPRGKSPCGKLPCGPSLNDTKRNGIQRNRKSPWICKLKPLWETIGNQPRADFRMLTLALLIPVPALSP